MITSVSFKIDDDADWSYIQVFCRIANVTCVLVGNVCCRELMHGMHLVLFASKLFVLK